MPMKKAEQDVYIHRHCGRHQTGLTKAKDMGKTLLETSVVLPGTTFFKALNASLGSWKSDVILAALESQGRF